MFDQGTPVPLRKVLVGHEVETAYERGWSSLRNGDLIAAAEGAGFAAFVTTDRSLKYQQNLTVRKLSVIVLLTTSWPRIQNSVAIVQAALDSAIPGDYLEVPIE